MTISRVPPSTSRAARLSLPHKYLISRRIQRASRAAALENESPKGGKTEAGLIPSDQWLDRKHRNASDIVAAGLEALDSLNLGIALADGSARLMLTNRTADQILAARDGVEVSAQGVLSIAKPSTGASLRLAIQHAAQATLPGQASSKTAALLVERPSGKRPLTMFVRPVQDACSPPGGSRSVLLFVLDPDGPIQATEASLRQLYGLTAREAHLARLLVSGKTIEECCDDLNIRASTARMHLANLFVKTGVQRQGQLISLLLKSIGVVSMAVSDRTCTEVERRAEDREFEANDSQSRGRAPGTLAVGLEALDLLHIGVGVINGQRQLLFANQTAHQILAARDGLEVSPQGVLSALTKGGLPSLNALTQRAAHAQLRGTPATAESVLAVPRPSGRRPLTLLLRTLNCVPVSSDSRGPAFLVFMLDPELPIPAVESGLRQLYGFTSREARLGYLLMEGNALDDCCELLGIRASTARMHLANMFGKAGVQRQGPLISLLLKSVGMVRVRDDERSTRTLQSRAPGFLAQIPSPGMDNPNADASAPLLSETDKVHRAAGAGKELRSNDGQFL